MLNEERFDAPIPGMSLTTEVGNRPWQNPPRYANTKDVVEYYIERMSTDEFSDMLIDVAETGIPLTTIANSIQMYGVMEGIHSVDSGILALPIIMEMMLLNVDAAGIKYNSGMSEEDEERVLDSELIVSKLQDTNLDTLDTIEAEPQEMPPVEAELNIGGGLMSRSQ
tara:strand:+ start:1205 stop:1705 length:501 start_codon:yes stop_codon:yes gene_type:complete